MGVAASTSRNADDGERFVSGDHYIVLGVAENATPEEIKIAFRKLALLHHPDKNVDDTERATQRFAIIQQAYETLNDGQKRYIYDSERSSRGPPPVPEPEDVTSTMPGFLRPEKVEVPRPSPSTSSSQSFFRSPFGFGFRSSRPSMPDPFSGSRGPMSVEDIMLFRVLITPELIFSEDGHQACTLYGLRLHIPRARELTAEQAFFTLYRKIFARIAQDEPDDRTVPDFGDATTSWNLSKSPTQDGSVRAFYASWARFQTSRKFEETVHVDVPPGGPRSARRKAHAKNKKIVQRMVAEYNDAVGSLVIMVRTVDPRYVCRNSICKCLACYLRNLQAQNGRV